MEPQLLLLVEPAGSVGVRFGPDPRVPRFVWVQGPEAPPSPPSDPAAAAAARAERLLVGTAGRAAVLEGLELGADPSCDPAGGGGGVVA